MNGIPCLNKGDWLIESRAPEPVNLLAGGDWSLRASSPFRTGASASRASLLAVFAINGELA